MQSRGVRFESVRPRAEGYLALLETTGWNELYGVDLERAEWILEHTTRCVSAYIDDELVGFARSLSDRALYAVVFDVIVAPDLQRQGIGAELVRRLIAWLDGEGVRDILLFAASDTAGFYERFGFRRRPEDAPGMLRRRK